MPPIGFPRSNRFDVALTNRRLTTLVNRAQQDTRINPSRSKPARCRLQRTGCRAASKAAADGQIERDTAPCDRGRHRLARRAADRRGDHRAHRRRQLQVAAHNSRFVETGRAVDLHARSTGTRPIACKTRTDRRRCSQHFFDGSDVAGELDFTRRRGRLPRASSGSSWRPCRSGTRARHRAAC